MSERNKIIIVNPILSDEFAGWDIQWRKFGHRNSGKFEFIYLYKGRDEKFSLLKIFKEGLKIRNSTKGKCVFIFPQFFGESMILVFLFGLFRAKGAIQISGSELDHKGSIVFQLRIILLKIFSQFKVICLNPDVDHLLNQHLTNLERRIDVIPVSIDPFWSRTITSGECASIRKDFGVSNGSIVIGCVGTICPRKQQHLLVSAVAELPIEEVTLFLCGDFGDHTEGSMQYYVDCSEDAAEKNLDVRFLGKIDHAELKQLYSILDIFVLPSIQEGTPNVVAEAIGMGIKVVGSSIPGIRFLLTESKGGFLFEPGAEKDCAKAIMEALSSDDPRYETKWLSSDRLDSRIIRLLEICDE